MNFYKYTLVFTCTFILLFVIGDLANALPTEAKIKEETKRNLVGGFEMLAEFEEKKPDAIYTVDWVDNTTGKKDEYTVNANDVTESFTFAFDVNKTIYTNDVAVGGNGGELEKLPEDGAETGELIKQILVYHEEVGGKDILRGLIAFTTNGKSVKCGTRAPRCRGYIHSI